MNLLIKQWWYIFNEFNNPMINNQDDFLAIQKCSNYKNNELDFLHFSNKMTTKGISNTQQYTFNIIFIEEVAFKFGL